MASKSNERRNTISAFLIPNSLQAFMTKHKDQKRRKLSVFGGSGLSGITRKKASEACKDFVPKASTRPSTSLNKRLRQQSFSYPNLTDDSHFQKTSLKKNKSSAELDSGGRIPSKKTSCDLKELQKERNNVRKYSIQSTALKTRRSTVVAISVSF